MGALPGGGIARNRMTPGLTPGMNACEPGRLARVAGIISTRGALTQLTRYGTFT
jgi:hypothetical protein